MTRKFLRIFRSIFSLHASYLPCVLRSQAHSISWIN